MRYLTLLLLALLIGCSSNEHTPNSIVENGHEYGMGWEPPTQQERRELYGAGETPDSVSLRNVAPELFDK